MIVFGYCPVYLSWNVATICLQLQVLFYDCFHIDTTFRKLATDVKSDIPVRGHQDNETVSDKQHQQSSLNKSSVTFHKHDCCHCNYSWWYRGKLSNTIPSSIHEVLYACITKHARTHTISLTHLWRAKVRLCAITLTRSICCRREQGDVDVWLLSTIDLSQLSPGYNLTSDVRWRLLLFKSSNISSPFPPIVNRSFRSNINLSQSLHWQ